MTITTKEESRIKGGDFSVTSYELSDDGKKIAYHRAPTPLLGSSADGEVWIANADGSGAVRLTNNGGPETNARVSPDDSRARFISPSNARSDTYDNRRLVVVPAAAGAARV